jgi:hypothetical protein
MIMNWIWCLNHDLTHAASENPRESPTPTFFCETKHISGGVASK